MNTTARALLLATAIVLVGGLLLKGASPASKSDPTASVDNGAPRGWLLLRLLLDATGHDVVVVKGVEGEGALSATSENRVVFVPPPERSAFSTAEASELLRVAEHGGRVVVVCDPLKARRNRLLPLLAHLNVTCSEQENALSPSVAVSTFPAVPSPVYLRDRGRLVLQDKGGLMPLLVSGDAKNPEVVAVVVAVGKGDVVVVGSGTVFANDGLAAEQSAAFLLWLVGERKVVVDERHHRTRGRAVIGRAALEGPGPLTAAAMLLLLLPLSLLAFAPRQGEFDGDDDDDAPAAAARVRALAALLKENHRP